MENQFFIRLPIFPVVICRQCQHGVWPSSIASHLKGSAHQVQHQEAQQVQEAIQQWDGIQHDSSQLELPSVLDERIPQLPIYPDGLLCWREYPRCGFVARSMETMKQHWRKIHGWSMQSHGGRMNRQQKEQAQIESQRSFRTVSCQRVFPTCKGSHFIHIRHPGGDIRAEAAAEPMASRLVDAMERSYQAQQQRQSAQGIEAGERDEANPWLRRTRWAEYLSLVPAQDLLDCIKPPEEDAARPEEIDQRGGSPEGSQNDSRDHTPDGRQGDSLEGSPVDTPSSSPSSSPQEGVHHDFHELGSPSSDNSSMTRETQRMWLQHPEEFPDDDVPARHLSSPVADPLPVAVASPSPMVPARIPISAQQAFQEQDVRRRQGMEQSRQQDQARLVTEEVLEQEVQEWQDRCWICAVGQEGSDHELYHCPQVASQAAQTWMVTVRRQIQYARYSGCFRCGMPQTICQRWQDQEECQDRGVLIPMVAMMLYGPYQEWIQPAWKRWLAGFGIAASNDRQVVQFLGQAVEGGQSSITGWWKHFVGYGIYVWRFKIGRSIRVRNPNDGQFNIEAVQSSSIEESDIGLGFI
jgi:uncharacterized C2H2 Zn-finger protein